MAQITWEKGNVPVGMSVKQVYGIFFDQQGRVLLRIEKGAYKLTGGKPEVFDSDFCATLRRELSEEANCSVEKLVMVGYQKVDEEDGSPAYAQIRMTGVIKEIGAPRPDIDKAGWIYGRVFVSAFRAAKLLNWGQVGINQIYDAAVIAQSHFGINIIGDDFFINEENVITDKGGK